MEDKGVFKMEKMSNNELENKLTEVTGGAGNAGDKGKKSELTPKPDSKTITCIFCKKEYPSTDDKVRKYKFYICEKCKKNLSVLASD